jgi:hypothetical protein
MKTIAAIVLVYSFVALAFILAICKTAARPTPSPPDNGEQRGTQQVDRTIHETHV